MSKVRDEDLNMDFTPKFNQAPRKKSSPTAPKRSKLQVVVQGKDIAVVTLMESRILDEHNVNELADELMRLVTQHYMVKMVIDMSNVQYLSSVVLRHLIALYKAIKKEKGDLKLCHVHPDVREVFKITQLDKMIEIKDSLDAAVNSFKKKGWGWLSR